MTEYEQERLKGAKKRANRQGSSGRQALDYAVQDLLGIGFEDGYDAGFEAAIEYLSKCDDPTLDKPLSQIAIFFLKNYKDGKE